jgi:hypothetical protein
MKKVVKLTQHQLRGIIREASGRMTPLEWVEKLHVDLEDILRQLEASHQRLGNVSGSEEISAAIGMIEDGAHELGSALAYAKDNT